MLNSKTKTKKIKKHYLKPSEMKSSLSMKVKIDLNFQMRYG